MRRLVTLAFFVYVAADLGCPLVPGAFRFDPQQCVDGASGHRERPGPIAPVVVPPDLSHSDLAPITRPRRRGLSQARPTDMRSHLARDHVAVLADPPAVEDH